MQEDKEEDYISAYEYEKNVNPPLAHVPFFEKDVNDCAYGIDMIDFSDIFNVPHTATTPNLLASFIRTDDFIELNNHSSFNATSHMFYIIKGSCSIHIQRDDDDDDDAKHTVCAGDILIAPCFKSARIQYVFTSKEEDAEEEVQIYYINDSPLVNYLGNIAVKPIFKTAVYRKDFLVQKLDELSNRHNNRKGILLSNKDTHALGINTITPVLWALYNELPPNTVQKPHKHNSVALDLCITCKDSENIYTLIGDELDEQGNIVNPRKVHWKEGCMFITPPGLWHSHNNDGETYAYILPVQDAGLLLYQRILGIVLQK